MIRTLWAFYRRLGLAADQWKNRKLNSTDLIVESISGVPARQTRILCLFAHFDEQGALRAADRHYLEALRRDLDCDIVFCSTGINLQVPETRSFLSGLTVAAISRQNKGYDFGSWKTGLDFIGPRVESYGFLLFTNNSVIGPAFSLAPLLRDVKSTELSVISMTESFEREFHLQSYFLLVPKAVFRREEFGRFWRNLYFLEQKKNIVYGNEMGFSRMLAQAGIGRRALFPTGPKLQGNPTHESWRDLLTMRGFPYVKRDLLKRDKLSAADMELVSTYFAGLLDIH